MIRQGKNMSCTLVRILPTIGKYCQRKQRVWYRPLLFNSTLRGRDSLRQWILMLSINWNTTQCNQYISVPYALQYYMHSSELDSQCVSAPTSRRAAVNVSEQQLQGSIKAKKAFRQQNIVSERVHLKRHRIVFSVRRNSSDLKVSLHWVTNK